MNTVKSSSEIANIFEHGQRIKTPDLNFIVACTEGQHDQSGRVAFIAGKKLGNAVWRNKAKRRMRSLCMDLGGPIPGFDVIFLARQTINDKPYNDILSRSKKALSKLSNEVSNGH